MPPSFPREPRAHSASLSASWGASPSFLSCSHSFYPRRDSLATSSAAVQLSRFVATLSSRALPSPGTPARPYSHSIHSGLYLAVEGHLSAGLSAYVPFPASLSPRHARLPFPVLGHPVATAFDFWSFPTSHQGVGGVRARLLQLGREPLCFPASFSGICFPLPSLFSL